MAGRIIRSIGIALLSLILVRGLQKSLLPKYRLFYIQAFGVLISALYLNPRVWGLGRFAGEYWLIQLGTMLLACAVMLEILNQVLLVDPRSRPIARYIRLVLLVAVSCFAFPCILGSLTGSPSEQTSVHLERDFRMIEALLLLAISGTVAYFGISMGRNLKGMFLGYGIYVAASLVLLAFHPCEGVRLDPKWYMLQPLSYDVGLIGWLAGLWSYSPPRVPHNDVGIKTKPSKVGIIALPSVKGLSC